MNPNWPQACPGSGKVPNEKSTCPVCDFVWVNIKFKKVTPTHGIVSDHQLRKVNEWAANILRYAV